MKFFVVKKNTLAVILAIIVFLISLISFVVISTSSSPQPYYSIVIDAGHGGIDNGSIGYSGTLESEINLWYAKTLQQYCTEFGFFVTMTRTNDNGLYSPFAKNKKKDDMKARQKIIESASPDMVISIHMNSFPESSSRGAQVFYAKDNNKGKLLADSIQEQFVQNLVKPRQNSEVGDYYIVNCTTVPSVIVECGFVSNPEEEQLLLKEDYKDKVCYSVVCGILKYLMIN